MEADYLASCGGKYVMLCPFFHQGLGAVSLVVWSPDGSLPPRGHEPHLVGNRHNIVCSALVLSNLEGLRW